MKTTVFAGLLATSIFAMPALAQEQPAKQETKNITININQDEKSKNGERKGKIKIVRNINGKEEVIEREFDGEMPADLKEKLKDLDLNIIDNNGKILADSVWTGEKQNAPNATEKKQHKVIVYKAECNTNNKKDNAFEFKFDEKGEIPADIKKMLDEKGIELQGNKVQVYKLADGKEVKVCISKVCIIKIDDTKAEEKKESKAEIAPEPQISDLTVYPNPNDGEFNLKFNLEQKGDAEVTLFDQQGNKLYEETLKNFSGEYKKPLQIKGQKSGNYILKIVQNGNIYTRQVLVK